MEWLCRVKDKLISNSGCKSSKMPKDTCYQQQSDGRPTCSHTVVCTVGRVDWNLNTTCWGSGRLAWSLLLSLWWLPWCGWSGRAGTSFSTSWCCSSTGTTCWRWSRGRLRSAWSSSLSHRAKDNAQDESNQDPAMSHQENGGEADEGLGDKRRTK
jgi:hypothetical protein